MRLAFSIFYCVKTELGCLLSFFHLFSFPIFLPMFSRFQNQPTIRNKSFGLTCWRTYGLTGDPTILNGNLDRIFGIYLSRIWHITFPTQHSLSDKGPRQINSLQTQNLITGGLRQCICLCLTIFNGRRKLLKLRLLIIFFISPNHENPTEQNAG